MQLDHITLKKIPKHLIPLFASDKGLLGYARIYSAPIVQFWQEAQVVDLEQTAYSELLQLLGTHQRVDKVSEPGEFAVRGDTITMWLIGYDHPIRLEYLGEQLEAAYLYDDTYGRKLDAVKQVLISEKILTDSLDKQSIIISPQLHKAESHIIVFSPFVPAGIQQTFPEIKIEETDYAFPQIFHGRTDLLDQELSRYQKLGYRISLHSRHPEDLSDQARTLQLGKENHFDWPLEILRLLPAGFVSQAQKQLFLTDREVFGSIHLGSVTSEQSSDKVNRILRQLEADIEIGDYIVHEDYGVAIYRGLKQEEAGDEIEDYILLEYAKEDQLFVPISQITKLTKYISDTNLEPKLTRLGKKEWDKLKKKVQGSVGILARELVEHYARRELATAPTVDIKDSESYQQFCERFPHQLTEDQKRTTDEVIADLAQSKPMNRLIVGDVGFGKTEVMMRAAFKMVEAGYQVAVLCPTTVLNAQHHAVFKERFANTGITVDSLSRFNTSKENRQVADAVNNGSIDIAIGTHRLLSGDIKFNNLGLLIIDEEQKFGVGQKEKIKKLNYGIHELLVTATPIPRTLSMALTTIQDISIISTPPENRLSVKTELVKNDWNQISKAIEKEISRGGQVYFIHNQVQTIQSIVARLKRLLPGISITYGHGQMPTSKLSKIMSDFYDHKYQVLVATTIVENGLDMPNVNTMIINQAHKFGLSQLYQLRGRVGRSERQAYCYLFYEGREVIDPAKELTMAEQEEQKKLSPKVYLERLQTIMNSTDLGSGFQIASRDLEIRGAGNLLGHEQSGHINVIGYSLYMQMLATEIEKLKAGVERGGIVSF